MKPEEMKALGIPEALHGEASLAEIKDVAGLSQAFVDTKKLVGGSIRIPGKDAGPEVHTAFRAKISEALPDLVEVPADPAKLAEVESSILGRLGTPKEAKEYPALATLKIEVPTGVNVDEANIRDIAHKLKMTRSQFKQFAEGVVAERVKAAGMESEARKALKVELGDAFDDRLLAAAHAAQKMGADEATVTAIRTGNVPAGTAKQWIGVANAIGMKGSNFNPENGGSGKMSPAEAQIAINELYTNPALTDKNHSSNKDLVKKLSDLHAIVYPPKK